MVTNLEPGQVVLSRAGRDKGNYFVVLKIGPEPFVYIADGESRRVERPKKKNTKHLKPLAIIITDINIKSRAKMRVSNQDVSEALKQVLGEKNDHKEV